MKIDFDNTYARELSGSYVPVEPDGSRHPELLYFNQVLADDLGLNTQGLNSQMLADIWVGNHLPKGAEPIAQAYAGHQFGYFNPQLGDGRALIMGEILDPQGQRFDIAFKGSGRTPFSRGGDGKAAIGPMLREVLIAEALYALGIPSTRSLAVVATGEPVYRESGMLPGAVLTRVASSHIRVGTFEFFAAHGEKDLLKRLADYTMTRHVPEAIHVDNPYLELLNFVIKKQAKLIAQWMSVGFIHGVMNTDNMTVSGETIDYGPCAFMEAYDSNAVFSSIDEYGRYAYGNQPRIAQWDLSKLAQALLPLIHEDTQQAVDLATEAVEAFLPLYQHEWLRLMELKLGLSAEDSDDENRSRNLEIVNRWLELLEDQQIDFTLAHYYLADAVEGNRNHLLDLFSQSPLFDREALDQWLRKWEVSLQDKSLAKSRIEKMRAINPWIIPRNHQVEDVLMAASEENNLKPFYRLLSALQSPHDKTPENKGYAQTADKKFTEKYQTFCGT